MSIFERPATSILHATDFSSTSDHAFAHALSIALANEAHLTILHVVKDELEEVPWHDYPSVRKTLEKWGKLEPGSKRSDVGEKLSIRVDKMVGVGKNVANAISGLTEVNYYDLIVMATGEHGEHPFWGGGHTDISLPVGQNTHLPILFVPDNVRGGVSLEDGSASLDRIVVAVDHQPDAQPALERITWALDKFGGENPEVTLLHVGADDNFPNLDPPSFGKYTWTRTTRQGNAAKQIVAVAEEVDANLIVMVTDWKKGIWDVLRGSTVEQVVKKSPCVVFAMPAEK